MRASIALHCRFPTPGVKEGAKNYVNLTAQALARQQWDSVGARDYTSFNAFYSAFFDVIWLLCPTEEVQNTPI